MQQWTHLHGLNVHIYCFQRLVGCFFFSQLKLLASWKKLCIPLALGVVHRKPALSAIQGTSRLGEGKDPVLCCSLVLGAVLHTVKPLAGYAPTYRMVLFVSPSATVSLCHRSTLEIQTNLSKLIFLLKFFLRIHDVRSVNLFFDWSNKAVNLILAEQLQFFA